MMILGCSSPFRQIITLNNDKYFFRFVIFHSTFMKQSAQKTPQKLQISRLNLPSLKSFAEDENIPVTSPRTNKIRRKINRFGSDFSFTNKSPQHSLKVKKWVLNSHRQQREIQKSDYYLMALKMLETIIQMDSTRLMLDRGFQHLDNFLQIMRNLDCKDFLIRTKLLKCDMYIRMGDLYEARRLLRILKTVTIHYQTPLVIKIYRYSGEVMLRLRNYLRAKHDFIKMLYFCWNHDDKINEAIAYDKISMCYFYDGETLISQIMHDWAMLGRVEKLNSPLRIFATVRVNHHLEKRDKPPEIADNTSTDEDDLTLKQTVFAEVKYRPDNQQLYFTHCSNNRQKNNHQILGIKDLAQKALDKRQKGFYFVMNETHIRHYKTKLLMIKDTLEQFSKQILSNKNKGEY